MALGRALPVVDHPDRADRVVGGGRSDTLVDGVIVVPDPVKSAPIYGIRNTLYSSSRERIIGVRLLSKSYFMVEFR